MKVLIGIDTSNAWRGVANLLVRMFPERFEAELIHCIESIMPDGSFPTFSTDHDLTLILKEHRRQAEEALDEADSFLSGRGVKCKKTIVQGNSSRVLLEHADSAGCDLVAVRSSVKSPSSALFFGSTAKAVVLSAKQSVLVAKNDHEGTDQVNALLSTDHSPYMADCIENLKKMDGIHLGKLTVFTTNESDARVESFILRDLPDIANLAPIWIKEKLDETNLTVATSLSKICGKSASFVGQENVKTAIPKAMKSTDSELLIMGAQGHNFFERLILGSQSMYQILHEQSSVLLLRK